MFRLSYLAIVLFTGVILTLATFAYQPKDWMVVGNVCNGSTEGYCFDRLRRAGFPLPYAEANTHTSPYGSLSFFEGFSDPVAFAIDIVIFSILTDFVIYRSGMLTKSHRLKSSNVVH